MLHHVHLLTFGVCPLTLPARANEPCTLPETQNKSLFQK